MRAMLFNLQRFSTEDGPGLRTTLFFKGCPLTCPWCHNPEGMRPEPELVWYDIDCVGCGACVAACPEGALHLEGRLDVDRRLCRACGTCVEACDTGALERLGREWELGELVEAVLKDRVFYGTSGGGVTLSGGEPLMQGDMVLELLSALRREGVSVALDTSGAASAEVFGRALGLVDLILLDLKGMDPARHRERVGVELQPILDRALMAAEGGVPMWVRTPVIPGVTDGEGDIREVARFVAGRLPSVERYDLLAFSNLCQSKYDRLGRPFGLAGRGLLSRARMEALAAAARAEGVRGVVWSGPVKEEEC